MWNGDQDATVFIGTSKIALLPLFPFSNVYFKGNHIVIFNLFFPQGCDLEVLDLNGTVSRDDC